MKHVLIILSAFCLLFSTRAMAMQGMDQSSMEHGSKMEGETFVHAVMVDGIHAEFQIMDLAAMNMKDPNGGTHHIMVSFLKNNEKMANVAGKIKLIAPSGKEQVADLKEYSGGVYAAVFKIDEMGKWGVISLFKDGTGNKHTVKFWYEHNQM